MADNGAKYLLDANVFITASNLYYAFDLVPKFWSCLVDLAGQGRAVSIDRVRDELVNTNDRLSAWASSDYAFAFLSTRDDPEVLDAYRNLQGWAQSQKQYDRGALNEFAEASCADAWLVAFAMAKGYTVATHEVYSNCLWKVKIPNACKAFGVDYVDTFKMLRALGVTVT
jgi:hypothetical protein